MTNKGLLLGIVVIGLSFALWGQAQECRPVTNQITYKAQDIDEIDSVPAASVRIVGAPFDGSVDIVIASARETVSAGMQVPESYYQRMSKSGQWRGATTYSSSIVIPEVELLSSPTVPRNEFRRLSDGLFIMRRENGSWIRPLFRIHDQGV